MLSWILSQPDQPSCLLRRTGNSLHPHGLGLERHPFEFSSNLKAFSILALFCETSRYTTLECFLGTIHLAHSEDLRFPTPRVADH
jgi:hypothetical protein